MIDFNNKDKIEEVRDAIQELIGNKKSYYLLADEDRATFKTLHENPPEKAGWYIVLNDYYSLYTGETKDLNDRINKQADYSYVKEKSSKRDFIQKFIGKGIFGKPYICVISKEDLRTKLELPELELDIVTIEKVIDIFRTQLNFICYDDI